MLAGASLSSVLIAASVAVPAYAWHPKGAIIKQVQNQTAGTAISDANDEASAVSAKTDDVLAYTITVSNIAAAAQNGDNDMAGVQLTDALPAGVELVGNASQRTISENLGTIKPGSSITKTYSVKITDTKDGDVITNKACFTGDSLAKDNPQSGCDVAVVKVSIPTLIPTPAPTPTPTPMPQTLPNTGSTAFTAGLFVVGAAIIGYTTNMVRAKRRSSVQ